MIPIKTRQCWYPAQILSNYHLQSAHKSQKILNPPTFHRNWVFSLPSAGLDEGRASGFEDAANPPFLPGFCKENGGKPWPGSATDVPESPQQRIPFLIYYPCPWQRAWNSMIFKVAANPNHSTIRSQSSSDFKGMLLLFISGQSQNCLLQ